MSISAAPYGTAAGLLLLLAAHPGLVPRLPLYYVWTGLAAAVGIGLLAGCRPRPWPPTRLLTLTGFWLGAGVLSVTYADAPWRDLLLPISQAFWLACGWYLARRPAALAPLAIAFIAGAAGAGLYGLIQYLDADLLPAATPFTTAGRVVSVFANPNHFGNFVAAAVPVGLVCFIRLQGHRQWLAAAAVAALYSGLVLSACRGAWWGAIGGALVVLIGLIRSPVGRRPRAWLRLGMLGILLAAVTFGLTHKPALQGPQGPVSHSQRLLSSRHIVGPGAAGDSTVNHRYFIWAVAWDMVRSQPLLGLGYGGFGRHFAAFRDGYADQERLRALPWHQRHEATPYAHNEFLHLWAETGLVGLLAFSALLAWGLVPALATAWQRRDLELSALIGLLAVLLIHSLVSYPLRLPLNGMLFWLGLGAAYAWPRPPAAQ